LRIRSKLANKVQVAYSSSKVDKLSRRIVEMLPYMLLREKANASVSYKSSEIGAAFVVMRERAEES